MLCRGEVTEANETVTNITSSAASLLKYFFLSACSQYKLYYYYWKSTELRGYFPALHSKFSLLFTETSRNLSSVKTGGKNRGLFQLEVWVLRQKVISHLSSLWQNVELKISSVRNTIQRTSQKVLVSAVKGIFFYYNRWTSPKKTISNIIFLFIFLNYEDTPALCTTLCSTVVLPVLHT